MNSVSIIRTIAKSTTWQTLYSQSKEITLPLFPGVKDYGELQVFFLYWLSFYHSINESIALREVTERVNDSEIFEDSYMYYKSLKGRDKAPKYNPKQSSKTAPVSTTHWIFKKK